MKRPPATTKGISVSPLVVSGMKSESMPTGPTLNCSGFIFMHLTISSAEEGERVTSGVDR